MLLAGTGTGTGKREEHNVERLKMAVSQLEFALERTRKLPITDVSLLNQRKMFKLAYIEATGLLTKQPTTSISKKAGRIRSAGDGFVLRPWRVRRRRTSTPTS